jgi:hypothetical protein
VGLSEGNELCLFELKNMENRKVGGLSELLFYAGVLRKGLAGDITPHRSTAARNCAISPAELLSARTIRAVLLAPKFHPLLEDRKVMNLVNEASAKRWTLNPVTFDLSQFNLPNGQTDDFGFNGAG